MQRQTLCFIGILFGAVGLSVLPVGFVHARDFNDSEVTRVDYPMWFKDSFLDLNEDLEIALAAKKKGLMILFTTDGCSYCDAFIVKSLGDPKLAAIVQQNFESIGLEIFSDAEMSDPRGVSMRVKEFAKREGAGFSPTLLFYGGEGERLFRAVGYQSPQRFNTILDYVLGEHYREETFRDFSSRLAATTAPGPATGGLVEDPLFSKPPYALDRSRFPASRPLMVIFEQGGCEDCRAFHSNVLSLSEVRDLLKRFEVVRLDADDDKTPVLTPDGRRATPASWVEQLQFSRYPALVFFDEGGKQVLSTDSLVMRQRMVNSCLYVLEKAYQKDWTYQRFARTRAAQRRQASQ